jgi:hypothetical protein
MWWTWLACGGGGDKGGDGPTGPAEPTLDDNFGVVEDQGTEGCDNLVPECLYPFPSDAYVTAEGTLAIPKLFANLFDPASTNRSHGYGAATPILFQLPGAVPPPSTVFDPADSLSDDGLVVLVDATTGRRLPHWIESDWLSPDQDPPLIVIRPSLPLPRGHEIVVGVRGLVDAAGDVVPATPAFAALRDRQASEWLGVHARRRHFEDVVFPALEGVGVVRDELQLAWSFPIQTDADATAPMLAVRDAVFAALPADGPEYTLDRVVVCDGVDDDPDCHPSIRVIVDGTARVPSAMDAGDDLGVRNLRLRRRRSARGRRRHRSVAVPLPDPARRLHRPGSDPRAAVRPRLPGFVRREVNGGWIRESGRAAGLGPARHRHAGHERRPIATTCGSRDPARRRRAASRSCTELAMAGGREPARAATAGRRPPWPPTPSPSLHRGDGRLAWDPWHGLVPRELARAARWARW